MGDSSNEKYIDTIKNLLIEGKVNILLGHSQEGLIQSLALKDTSSLASDDMRNQINKVQLYTFGTPIHQSILPKDFRNAISIHNEGDILTPLPLQREFYPGKGYGHDIEDYIYDIRKIRNINY